MNQRTGRLRLMTALLLCLALLPLGAAALSPLRPPVKPPKLVITPKPIVRPTPLPTAIPKWTEQPGNWHLLPPKPTESLMNPDHTMPRSSLDLDKLINRPQKTGWEDVGYVRPYESGPVSVFDNYYLEGSPIGSLPVYAEFPIAVYTRGVAEIIGGEWGYIGGFVALRDVKGLRNNIGYGSDPGDGTPWPMGEKYIAVINSVGDLGGGVVDTWPDASLYDSYEQVKVGDFVVAQNYSNSNAAEIWGGGVRAYVPVSYLDYVGTCEPVGP